VVERLRELGHDVLTTQDSGRANEAVPDDAVLAFAIEGRRAVLTLNRKHFIRLHREQPGHTGIIVCTFNPDFFSQAERIHQALSEIPSLDGRLIRINRGM
jgi:hypothetical protein